jgi:capsular exopolysaccharide synthesis family protein
MEFEDVDKIGPPAQEFNLKKYLLRLLRRWPIIVSFFLVALLIGFAINRYSTPKYLITARITTKKFSNKQTTMVPGLVDASFFLAGLTEVYEEIPILKSRQRIEATLDRVDFEVSYFAKGLVKESELDRGWGFRVEVDTITGPHYPYHIPIYVNQRESGTFQLEIEDPEWHDLVKGKEFEYNRPVTLGDATFIFTSISSGPHEENKYYFKLNRESDLLSYYGSQLQINWAMQGSSMLDLSLESELPERDIKFMTAYYEVVEEMGLEEKNETLDNTIKFIDFQMRIVTDSLNFYQGLVDGLKLENRKISAGSQQVFDQLDAIDASRAAIMLKERYFKYLTDYFESKSSDDVFAPSLVGLDVPLLEDWVNKYINARLMEKNLRTEENRYNPMVNREDSVKRKLIKGIYEAINSEKVRNKQALDELSRQTALMYASISDVQANSRHLTKFERLYQINYTLYDLFLRRKAEAAISKASASSDYKVINAPTFSPEPIKPNANQNLLVAALVGLFVPIGFFLAKDVTNTRVMDKDDLERCTTIPLLGNVAHSDFASRLIMKDNPKSVVAESLRAIRANLKFLAVGASGDSHVLLVTSSIGGEGKTFFSINLAYTLAVSQYKTILIGADLRKPQVANYLAIKSSNGLSTYLSGHSPLEDLIIKGEENEPDVIDAGKLPPNPSELLASVRMKELIEHLKQHYKFIIIDTPPIGLVSDAAELFKFSDRNIIIVRQGVTKKEALKMVEELHRDGKIQKCNIIFNDIGLSKRRNSVYGSYVYGLGYGGYGYGYYEEDSVVKNRKQK